MKLPSSEFFVKDVMIDISKIASINKDSYLIEAIEKINMSGIGIACIVDKNKKLAGIITDGDLRRIMVNIQKPFSAILNDDALKYANPKPLIINPNDNISSALLLMEDNLIWDLPVVENNKLVGLFHLHSVIKKILQI